MNQSFCSKRFRELFKNVFLRRTRRHRKSSKPQDIYRLNSCEGLESRAMLAVYPVTNTLDLGVGSLRQAIIDANTSADSDTIIFQIPLALPIISLATALPTITDPVLIDGSTQSGYLTTTPIVEINGSAVSGAGLHFISPAGGSTIRALSIYGFKYDASIADSGNGILVDGSGLTSIVSSFIGINADGTATGNAVAGILVKNATATTLVNNVISQNGASGVILENDSDSSLTGNRIGIAPDDIGSGLGNKAHGILALGSAGTIIGGSTTASRNIISGNALDGIHLAGTTSVTILGNYIGVDRLTGSASVPNTLSGISIAGDDTVVGDGTIGGRNIISGNNTQGIIIVSGLNSLITGNYVGVSASGVLNVGNVLEGIRIDGGSGHTIGGTFLGNRNVISANGDSGITITAEASNILIQQNLIGLGTTLLDLGNGGDGISIVEASDVVITYSNRIAFNANSGVHLTGASGNRIGADSTRPVNEQGIQYGNAIYRNKLYGVLLESESNSNTIAANLIGLATPNGALLGNEIDGISVQESRTNTIGGLLSTTGPSYGNIIAANAIGVSVLDCDSLLSVDGNQLLGNTIRNNSDSGVLVDNSSNQTIGGISTTSGNIITLNQGNGVEIQNGSDGIIVQGNFIGTNSSGQFGFGNTGAGISILQSNNSVIGGTIAGNQANTVVGNGSDGLVIIGIPSGNAQGNLVEGNILSKNLGSGIRIANASGNTVGNTLLDRRNYSYKNSLDGIRIDTNANSNTVIGNLSTENGGAGVRIIDSYSNQIGTFSAGAGNEVYLNIDAGIVISSSIAASIVDGNSVNGNILSQNLHGILLIGSSYQSIGAESPNTISVNRGDGIRLVSDSAIVPNLSNNNFIVSNLIGGVTGQGNKGNGVQIIQGSQNILIGNSISGNTLAGVRVLGGATPSDARIGNNNEIGRALTSQNTVSLNRAGGIVLENNASQNFIVNTQVKSNIGVGIQILGSQNNSITDGTEVFLNTTDGILVTTQSGQQSTGTLIEGIFVGTDSLGSTTLGNQGVGIRLSITDGVIVGTNSNVAYNRLGGIQIENVPSTSLATGNVIRGAFIHDNLTSGIIVTASSNQSIGGIAEADTNLITSNKLDGVALTGNSKFLSVQNNSIYTNARHGISLTTVNDNSISDGNEIGGNGLDGVYISKNSTRNTLSDNFIGITATGLSNGNSRDGVGLLSVNRNTLADNLIANNFRNGITVTAAIASSPSAGNLLIGNLIDQNLSNGIAILGSRNQVVGGLAVNQSNVITNNGINGIIVGSLSQSILIAGNLIGTDEVGTNAGNTQSGIEVNNSTGTNISLNDVRFNRNGLLLNNVKGTAAVQTKIQTNQLLSNISSGINIVSSTFTLIGGVAQGNTVGLNSYGILLNSSSSTAIESNFIGFDELNGPIGNTTAGVSIVNSIGNAIRSNNTISYNAVGIEIVNSNASTLAAGNRVESNLIANNIGDGVSVSGGARNTIGGVDLGNVIIGNGGNGIHLSSLSGLPTGGSTGNLIRGNMIGTTFTGDRFPNTQNGIRITNSSSTIIDRNTISYNTLSGVLIAAGSNNVVGSAVANQGNRIVENGRGILIADSTTKVAAATTRSNVIAGNTISGSVGDGVTVMGSKTVGTVIGTSIVNGKLNGRANSIESNFGFGVNVTSAAQQVGVQGNSIVDNTLGGISLATGTNTGRAATTLTRAILTYPSRGTPQIMVTGTLTGVTAGQQYQVDVYSSLPENGTLATLTGYQGQTYLGQGTITAQTSGTLPFTISVTSTGAQLGDVVTLNVTTLRTPAGTSSGFTTLARRITSTTAPSLLGAMPAAPAPLVPMAASRSAVFAAMAVFSTNSGSTSSSRSRK